MHRESTSFIGLAFTLLCSVTACDADDPEAKDGQSDQAATGAGSCVVFAGNPHCSMGSAVVSLGQGKLTVGGMRTAGVDGVSIDLPDVTSFEPKGVFQTTARRATIIARSINQGVSTSTLTTVIDSRRMTLSASFTGNGQGSKYSAVFYRMGQEVGRLANIANGAVVAAPVGIVDPNEDPDYDADADVDVDPFHVRPTGACVWIKTFTRSPAFVVLNGRQIFVDKVELVEEVPAGGSYPYLSFNRIEYTYDGGMLTLTGEEIR